MAADFSFIIIGHGMMGAAAARHLSSMVPGVALIGPLEPVDRKTHSGVFSSHYDEARITRTFDDNPVWSMLATRSIERYAALEAESGIRFFHAVGCLFSGPAPSGPEVYLGRALAVKDDLGLDVETIPHADLSARFPLMRFPAGHTGYLEHRHAGHVNPRALVRAQAKVAAAQGTAMIAETVVAVHDRGDHAEVVTAEGNTYSAGKVLVAAGGFTNLHALLPRPVEMSVRSRTVVFFELSQDQQAAIGPMPSTVVFAERDEDLVYILPPVAYPDGKTYLKIGGDSEARSFTDIDDIRRWFQSDGDPAEAKHLIGIMLELMPMLGESPVSSAACVASFTATSYPYIGMTGSPRIGVLTGGNFVAAKCSDELGRLGAVLMTQGGLGKDDFGEKFTPVFLAD